MAIEGKKSSDSANPATSNSAPNCNPVPGPPPPPRNDSLNTVKNAAQNSLSSGPATPGMAHAAQRHSSLDISQKENVASALNTVLKRIHTKEELPTSPQSHHTSFSPSSNAMFSIDDVSPSVMPHDTNMNRAHKVTSPVGVSPPTTSSENTTVSITTESERKQGPPPLIKQGSLYISPRKLTVTGLQPLEYDGSVLKRKAGQILKAGGVDSGDLTGSRSNLLEAIRKGIQLRKVLCD